MAQIVTRNEDNTTVLKPIIEKSIEILKNDPDREVLKELQLLVALFKRVRAYPDFYETFN